MTLPEWFRALYEIGNYWVMVEGKMKIYIAETASKGFVTFSFYDGVEEDDYQHFPSYDDARKYVSSKYRVTGRMKKVKS